MPNFCERIFSISSTHKTAASLAIAVATGMLLTPPASAQVVRSVIPVQPLVVLAQAATTNPETVRLLVGLSSMERDMMLGMLFAEEALANMPESHFADPRLDFFPALKDGLAAAGITDLEPLLVAVEASTDKDSLIKTQAAANSAVLLAEAALHPTDKDQVLAVIESVREANGRFNTAGPTDVVNYQDAWGTLMIQRGKLDLLMQSDDPVVAKAASDMATDMDDVILSMPDPVVTEPVPFDPAAVAALLAQLETLASGL